MGSVFLLREFTLPALHPWRHRVGERPASEGGIRKSPWMNFETVVDLGHVG